MLPLAVALCLAAAAAACSSGQDRERSAAPPSARAAIEARGREYSALVGRMDHERIAAMFVGDGELLSSGSPPIRGRQQILQHLESFASYRVLANRMTSDAVTVQGDSATQVGSYWQRVQLPDGKTIEVGGGYRTEWAQQVDGGWRIRRMETMPSR